MHVVISHYVSDSTKWDRSTKNNMSKNEQHRLPAGLNPQAHLPSVEGRNADCVWEAGFLGALQKFIERETSGARNKYTEVKAKAAIGLHKGEEPARAA